MGQPRIWGTVKENTEKDSTLQRIVELAGIIQREATHLRYPDVLSFVLNEETGTFSINITTIEEVISDHVEYIDKLHALKDLVEQYEKIAPAGGNQQGR